MGMVAITNWKSSLGLDSIWRRRRK